MKIVTLFCAAVASAALLIAPARAAILTETFTFTGAIYSVSGQFTYDQSTGHLGSMSGSVAAGGTTTPITGLVTGASPFFPDPSNSNGFIFDNLFDAASGMFSVNGVLFAFGANYGLLYYNDGSFGYNSGTYFSTWLPDGPTSPSGCSVGDLYCPGESGTISFTAVSPVPEPSTWAMLLLGLLAMGFVGRTFRTSPAATR